MYGEKCLTCGNSQIYNVGSDFKLIFFVWVFALQAAFNEQTKLTSEELLWVYY